MTRYQIPFLLVAITLLSPLPRLLAQAPTGGNVYPVQNVIAGQLAPRVKQVLAQGSLPAEVVVDRTHNRLIVRGGPDAQRVAAQAIGALDVKSVSTQPEDAPVLRTMPVPGGQLFAVAKTVGLKYRQNLRVRITPDEKTGQLLVLAPKSLQAEIAGQVNTLTHGSEGSIRQVSATTGQMVRAQFSLNQVSWRDFEDGLNRLAGRRLPVTTKRNGELATFELVSHRTGKTNVQVDRRNNNVTIVGPKQSIGGWRRVIETLDGQTQRPGEFTQLMRVQNAEPAPIRRAVQLMKNIRPVVAQEDDTIGVVGGNRSNPLLNAALQRATNQNGQAAGGEGAAVGMAQEGGASGLFGDVQIEFVPELGVIIVRGAKRDVERVMEVIDQIESQAKDTQPEVEVVSLQHANSNAVAAVVVQLYEEMFAPRQGQVSITALDKPNAILLIGRKEAVAGVIGLIEKVDQPVASTSELKVIKLKHASALDVQTTIQSFFVSQPGSDDELRPGLGTRVRIIADYRTNSIIAQASPRDMQEVMRMVEELDVLSTGAASEIKVFKLKNAFAEDLQPILQEAISGQPEETNEGVTTPSTALSILSVDPNGNKTLDSGILTGVVVTADPNVNALVVRAPGASMALIAELIGQLDQLPGAESVVKVFTIVNGDATQLADSLQVLFALDAQNGQGATNANLAALNLTAGAETSLIPLRFSVDVRTNSIIASGSESDLLVVESLLIRLDTEGFSSRITETVWLRNAASDDVAAALTDFINQQTTLQQRNQFFSQNLGPYDFPERDIIVASEPRTNSVIFSVSPRLYDSVRRIIDQLDRRPPMVMIQVLLAEVELTDGFEFGTELGLQDSILFDRGIAGTSSNSGFNFINANVSPGVNNLSDFAREQVAGQAVSAFALGRQSADFGYGGFVLSAASESVNLLLRTLQDAGRAQILSRPQIMTLDGTTGNVQVGALFPRIANVQFSQNGVNTTPIITTEDINLGLILQVTPRVGQDGLIVMDVDAQRSQVDPNLANGQPLTTDANGNPIISPQILITQAQSTVTAMSGQTVVFGGLITKERRQFSRRIPFVSNIPILGNLFRYDQETERRSELLIVLTPRVVDGDDDIHLINEAESSRMSYCLADVVEMHGDAGLNGGYGLWGPAVGSIIYPDSQPTVDHFPVDNPLVAPGEQLVPGSVSPPIPMDSIQMEYAPMYEGPAAGEVLEPATIEPASPIAPPAPMPTSSAAQPYRMPSGPGGLAGAPQRIPMEAFGVPGPNQPRPTHMPVGYSAPVLAPQQQDRANVQSAYRLPAQPPASN